MHDDTVENVGRMLTKKTFSHFKGLIQGKKIKDIFTPPSTLLDDSVQLNK